MSAQMAEAGSDLPQLANECGPNKPNARAARPFGAAALTVQEKIAGSKRSYVTRRLDLSSVDRLIDGDYQPKAGDIAICTVTELGQHGHLELVSGRRSKLFVDDMVVVAYGERYATDQFHALLPVGLSACSLAAAGGVAGDVVARHAGVKRSTRLQPLGVLATREGAPLNLASAALPAPGAVHGARKPLVITVLGSSMNAGKSTTAANIIRSLRRQNLKVAAVKLTGTGSGGDCWLFRDAGADPVLDFTDAGYASTYNVPIEALERAARLLFDVLSAAGPDFIICEIADGLLQQETHALLGTTFLKEKTDSVIFAAGDPISAAAGVHILAAQGYLTAAISGLVSASPLAAAEAARATGLMVLTQEDLLGASGGAHAFLLPARRGAI